ncbi:universal stress protein [uncultured Desulfobacter sp.]|uniref:universal stress protein n=1 Tax=uncultured Desulfobacter sp. TaxID=240139 RepID=UPI002AABEFE7|nr:universal stress protein [uncultured Desulfobacter sp.]
MNILTVVNDDFQALKQDRQTVLEAARIARQTWADVTLLGLYPNGGNDACGSMMELMRSYKQIFLDMFKDLGDDCPYTPNRRASKTVMSGPGIYEDLEILQGRFKNLSVRVRVGNPGSQVLAEAADAGSGLIVMGNHESTPLCRTVANDAACSVLAVKGENQPRRVVCCLDQESISQASLEMVNQLTTAYQAELELVGITHSGQLKEDVDRQMDLLVQYYQNQGITALVRLVDASTMEDFFTRYAVEHLICMWMGEKSRLQKLFARQGVTKLIDNAQSSVLILR